MTSENPAKHVWNELIGEDLSGVVFVRDYLQFQFNPPPQVNAYSMRVTVSADSKFSALGDEPFANMAIALIGQFVQDVKIEDGQCVRIWFVSGSEIAISLRPRDYRGPEAVEFQGRNGQTVVI